MQRSFTNHATPPPPQKTPQGQGGDSMITLCRLQSMAEVAVLSANTGRMRALGIVIAALNIEQSSGNAPGNVMVSEYL